MATPMTGLKKMQREIEKLKKRVERLEKTQKPNGRSKASKSSRARTKSRKLRVRSSRNGGELTEFDKLFGSIDMGKPLGTNNEEIDRDLAREYGDPHTPTHAD